MEYCSLKEVLVYMFLLPHIHTILKIHTHKLPYALSQYNNVKSFPFMLAISSPLEATNISKPSFLFCLFITISIV